MGRELAGNSIPNGRIFGPSRSREGAAEHGNLATDGQNSII